MSSIEEQQAVGATSSASPSATTTTTTAATTTHHRHRRTLSSPSPETTSAGRNLNRGAGGTEYSRMDGTGSKPGSVVEDQGGVDDMALGSSSSGSSEELAGDNKDHSSPSGGRTNSSGGTTLTGTRYRSFDAIQFASFQSLRRELPFRLNSRPLFNCLIYGLFAIQILGFGLHPNAYYSLSPSASASTSEYSESLTEAQACADGWTRKAADVGWWILMGVNYVRGGIDFVPILFWVAVGITLAYNFAFLFGLFQISRGQYESSFWLLFPFLKFSSVISPCIFPLLFRVCLSAVNRDSAWQSASSNVISAVGIICFILLLLDSLHISNLMYEFRKSWGMLSCTTGFHKSLIYCAAALSTLTECLLLPKGGTSAVAHFCIIGCFWVVCLAEHLYLQAYFNTTINKVEAGFLSCLVFSCFTAVAVTGAQAINFPACGTCLIILAITFIGLFLSFWAGILFIWIRNFRILKYLPNALHRGTKAVPFSSVVMYDIAAKIVSASATPETLKQAEKIYKRGRKAYPNSAYLCLNFASFLIDVKKDSHAMAVQIRHAKDMKPWEIQLYASYCLSKSVNGKSSDGDEKEMNLAIARQNHSAAKKKIVEFWTTLLRNNKSGQRSKQLMLLTSSLDFHEKTANQLFQKLVAKFSRDPEVLRYYALFLMDICDDREQADQLYALADEFDSTPAGSKNNKDVRFFLQTQAAAEQRMVQNQAKQEIPPHTADSNQTSLKDQLQPPQIPASSSVHSRISQLVTNSSDLQPSTSSNVVSNLAVSPSHSSISESPFLPSTSPGVVSASSVHSAGQMNSDNRTKLLQFKSEIDGMRSQTTLFLRIALASTIILLLVCTFAIVIIHKKSIATIYQHYENIADAGDVFYTLMSVLSVVRGWQYQISNGLNMTPSFAHEKLLNASQKWTSLYDIETDIDLFQLNTTDFFPDGPCNTNYCNNGEWANSSQTLNDAVTQTVYNLRTLLSIDMSKVGNCESSELRFLLDNFVQNISPMQDGLLDDMLLTPVRVADRSLVIICSVFCITSVLCITIFLLLFSFNIRKLGKERESTLDLFYDIPKSTLHNLLMKFSSEEDRLKIEGKRLASGFARVDTLQLMWISFSVAILLVFSVTTVVFVISVTCFSSGESSSVYYLHDALELQHSLGQVAFLNRELVVSDVSTWSRQEVEGFIVREVDEAREFSKLIDAERLDESDYLMFDKECPPVEHLQPCIGMSNLMSNFMDMSLLLTKQSQVNSTNEIYLSSSAAYSVIYEWKESAVQAIFSEPTKFLNQMLSLATFISIINLPIALVAFAYSYSVLGRLSSEISRTLRLLLMLPLNILETVDSIREFFENGCCSAYIKASYEDQQRRTQLILQASKDAVIGTNQKCSITIFNPSAEQLFGYAADEVLGKNIRMFLNDVKADSHAQAVTNWVRAHSGRKSVFSKKKRSSKVQNMDESTASALDTGILNDNEELQMKGKDGASISVLMSTCCCNDSDGFTFVSFIKDIRTLKQQQEELEKQRRRADELLLNILPSAVIEDLKFAEPGKVVAQLHTEVTILFADIQSFTPMASLMDPTSLVILLNDLFSRWDSLCPKYGIEKIKTIGDAFMAASGLPHPCEDHASRMIEFAMAMLRSLAAFNKKHASNPPLSVRIGVNTGSVVAGIIGTNKFQYDLWGDAVNLAARLESVGVPNRIQVGPRTYEILADTFTWESRGLINIKGKGDVPCYLLEESVGASTTASTASIKSQDLTKARDQVLF
ncbi:PAS domain S-box protein [Pelomyxa schiedti]|nr:PAS domain S-box protein [Pelomyxa schiedti]